jgi:hypothetical protein
MLYAVVPAVMLLAALVAVDHKKNILDCLAVCSAGLVLVLYFLAFFRSLWAITIVAVITVPVVVGRSIYGSGKRAVTKAASFAEYLKVLADPFILAFIAAVALVAVATKDLPFTWWDDINFWSSDAKQIFYMGGFPGKYGNVSPEFGDYPPVTSLFKWLFLTISGKDYTESLQFAGYFALNGVFLLPLMGRLKSYIDESGFSKGASILLSLLSFGAVMLLPGAFNGIIYYGTPADITMAIVYADLLLAIYDQYQGGDVFYFTRIGLYAAVLLLTKSVAFEWTIFALVLYFLMGKRDKKIWYSVLAAGLTYSSWLGFCLVNRRVAKLTGAGIKMATSGSFSAPDNAADKLGYFVQGFLSEPMHSDHNITLDLSAAGAVLLIFAGIFFLYNRKLLGRGETKKTFFFTLFTGLVSFGIVFLAHISIFGTEDQYLDAYAMGISISRYCAPFTLGMSIFLLGLMFNRLRSKEGRRHKGAVVFIFAAAVLLTADYSGVSRHLWGYRENLEADAAAYEDMVGDEGRLIVSAVSDAEYVGHRVLVLQDGHSSHWVHNAYISKEASPVPLVYDSYIIESDTADSIIDKIRRSHAEYFLVVDETLSSAELFSQIIGEGYEPGKVYRTDGNVY